MIVQQLQGQQVLGNTSKISSCKSGKGKEGSVLPSEAYSYKLSTDSSDLAKKNNTISLQETIASGCLGCWFLQELLLSELAAKWFGNVSPTAGKTQQKRTLTA